MKRLLYIPCILFPLILSAQNNTFTPGGFIRSGVYITTGTYKQNINTVFADAALKLKFSDGHSFAGSADLRIGERKQYGEDVSAFKVRESWVTCYGSLISITAGKKIVKWGRTDFFTPLSRFNPIDYSFRSCDNEDMDMGEFIAEADFTPSPVFRVSVVASPLWNPSVLLTRPMTLPLNVSLTVPEGFQTGSAGYSYGIRACFTIRQTDFGFQWFHGADPMPGLKLDSADFTNIYNPYIIIKGVPCRINNYGFDFETAISSCVIRGTLSYTKPIKGKEGREWVPFPQLECVAGIDWTPGDFRITAEYSCKMLMDYYKSPYSSLIGTKPDLAELMMLFSSPGFDPVEYARLQTEAFNRLYNNQINKNYHSFGLRVERELLYGRLLPSLTGMYNITSGDLMILPSVKYTPADNISVTAGAENYSGKKGGLYTIIDDFMNAVFVMLRIDF